jgi:hypothetical protein
VNSLPAASIPVNSAARETVFTAGRKSLAAAAAVAEAGISANVLAVFYHDYVLVPAERAGGA